MLHNMRMLKKKYLCVWQKKDDDDEEPSPSKKSTRQAA
jgi:hypothetical protein